MTRLETFGQRVTKSYPKEAERWNLKEILNWRTKDENFYKPLKYAYERGRFAVEVFSESESIAHAMHQELYSRYKPEFLDVFQNRPSYLAPVIRIRLANGDGTYASHPPYLKTCAYGQGRFPAKGETSELSVGVPNYDSDKC